MEHFESGQLITTNENQYNISNPIRMELYVKESYNYFNEFNSITLAFDKENYAFLENYRYKFPLSVDFKDVGAEYVITITSRFASSSTNLGSITKDNYHLLPLKFQEHGINLSLDDLMNARVCGFDVKRDLLVAPKNKISVIKRIRELMLSKAKDRRVIYFIKKLGYRNSVVSLPVAETVVDNLAVYDKYKELRYVDSNYFGRLNYEYFETVCSKMLRFERRVRKARNIRQVLRLDKKEKVTLNHLLDSKIDLVAEKIKNDLGLNMYNRTLYTRAKNKFIHKKELDEMIVNAYLRTL